MDALEQYARQQYGVVSRAQVVEALGNRSSIAWKVTKGELQRVHELVYRLRGAPPSWERGATEALFIGGDGAALSHRTAAFLHNLDGFKEPAIIDVAAPRNGVREFTGVKFHRSRQGPGEPVWCRHFLPITPVHRTIVDLAAELTQEALELALDSAQRQYKYFAAWLTQYLQQLSPQSTPGLAALKVLLGLRTGVTDSPLEVLVLRVLRRKGFPPWVEQFKVYDHRGKYVMRLDFAWPELKIAVHVDSYLWHHQRERFDRDARQRSRLHALGWRTITITATSLREGTWVNDLWALLNPQAELALH